MGFKPKDWDLLKDDFYDLVWGLLVHHNIIKQEAVPKDKSKLNMTLVNDLTDDRKPEIQFLIRVIQFLDEQLPSPDHRDYSRSRIENSRKFSGFFDIILREIYDSYKRNVFLMPPFNNPNRSYVYKHGHKVIGITDVNVLDPKSKALFVERACTLLSQQMYEQENGEDKLRATHRFSDITGFDCSTYLTLGIQIVSENKPKHVMLKKTELAESQKAAAEAEKKRQAEADKAAGKTTSIFGSFFSKPATAGAVKDDPVLAALAQEEEEAASALP
ncbi:hypothetical protein [Legionella sp. CNM-4043-24]|uniref:hypothetical protein n=1 Tax=Legionella sp. CNM-4043-24 TaxID=3421646 RepID=UPI00403B07C8